jgi:hypothetical protein
VFKPLIRKQSTPENRLFKPLRIVSFPQTVPFPTIFTPISPQKFPTSPNKSSPTAALGRIGRKWQQRKKAEEKVKAKMKNNYLCRLNQELR